MFAGAYVVVAGYAVFVEVAVVAVVMRGRDIAVGVALAYAAYKGARAVAGGDTAVTVDALGTCVGAGCVVPDSRPRAAV